MRELIVLGVIGVVITDRRRCGANVGVAAAQENRGAADRIRGIDVRGAHRARGIEAVLRIEPDHDQAIVDAGLAVRLRKSGGSKFQDRAAQRVAGVVGEDHDGGHAADGGRERHRSSILVAKAKLQRQRGVRRRRGGDRGELGRGEACRCRHRRGGAKRQYR